MAGIGDLDPQSHVDVLGEIGNLSSMIGDNDGDGSSRTSIRLAESAGVQHSPPAWCARLSADLVAGNRDDARLAAETTIAVSDQRGDRLFSGLATAVLAGMLASVGELDESAGLVTEALR
jgi:hypothetical protein